MFNMPCLHAIVAMAENRAIAYQDRLPWHLPLEYKWFKYKTLGSTLIMGRKTREAIGKALPGRINLVLSRSATELPDSYCFSDARTLEAELPKDKPSWVVGGAEIYRQYLPQCSLLYLSRIKQSPPGDIFFPPFEDLFTLDQVIHENADFRVERWLLNGCPEPPPELWPFPLPTGT